MAVRITQVDDDRNDRTILRVEGKLQRGDAEILERTFDAVKAQSGRFMEIDISGLSFIDSEGAAVLKRVEANGAALTGLDFFARQVIEAYESAPAENKE